MFTKNPRLGKILVVMAVIVFFVSALNDWIIIGAFVSPLMLAFGILKIVMPERNERAPYESSRISYNTSPLNRLTPKPSAAPAKAPAPVAKRADIKMYVTGLAYEGRQGIIEEWKNSMYDPYDGMSNKDLKEEGDGRYYKYPRDTYSNDITFEPDPTNQYDTNAIKVLHSDMGLIGYIPKDDTARIHKLLSAGTPFSVEAEVYGGPYKDVDDDEVTTNKENYGITLRIYKS
jgi:hypothetical protein